MQFAKCAYVWLLSMIGLYRILATIRYAQNSGTSAHTYGGMIELPPIPDAHGCELRSLREGP